MSARALSRDDHYLYQIGNSPPEYYTGTTGIGLQVLVVVSYPSLVTIFFDQDGNLIEVQDKELTASTRQAAKGHGTHEYFSRGFDLELASWLPSIGYREKTINVKRFFLEKYYIGISDFPDYLQKILENPACYSDDEQQVARNELERWSSEGVCEFWLNRNVNRWIDCHGKIEST